MEYVLHFEAMMIVFIAAIVVLMTRSHGLHGRFFYVDKRNKDVNLHLAIFGTPRKKSGAHKVVTSLENCLQHLKNNGYTSAILESHLITKERMVSVYRLARKYDYSVKDVSEFPTPTWQRFLIPISMALVKFKVKFANTDSLKLTIVLN
ncbi:hypothetical protein [Pantoea agglomerans]|uniref:hypothetical protein n=1 Tax=Enterobacter agglomerans TaxID=549 RepID=UPI003C7A4676